MYAYACAYTCQPVRVPVQCVCLSLRIFCMLYFALFYCWYFGLCYCLYFVFYEFDVENSFPKIDEIAAFAKHVSHFGRSTRNKERANTFVRLGCNLIWHDDAFFEVLEMKLPSGIRYADAFGI